MGTAVAFHTGVVDKVQHVCRLLRKAYRQEARVAVVAPADLLQKLDVALWCFEPQEFVPHLRLRKSQAPTAAQQRTPVWLLEPGVEVPEVSAVVNLCADRLAGDERFPRVIEVVSVESDDASAGRRRWKQYEADGWSITHHRQDAAA